MTNEDAKILIEIVTRTITAHSAAHKIAFQIMLNLVSARTGQDAGPDMLQALREARDAMSMLSEDDGDTPNQIAEVLAGYCEDLEK